MTSGIRHESVPVLILCRVLARQTDLLCQDYLLKEAQVDPRLEHISNSDEEAINHDMLSTVLRS